MIRRFVKYSLISLVCVYLFWLFSVRNIRAQGIPEPVKTVFNGHCQTVGADGLTIKWGYTSDGVERFIGSDYVFTTQPGSYPDAFSLLIPTGQPIPVLGLAKWETDGNPGTGLPDQETGEIRYISTDVTYVELYPWLPDCSNPESTPEPTPNGSEYCPAQQLNPATLLPYCYTPQPNGLIPLPPAPEGSK